MADAVPSHERIRDYIVDSLTYACNIGAQIQELKDRGREPKAIQSKYIGIIIELYKFLRPKIEGYIEKAKDDNPKKEEYTKLLEAADYYRDNKEKLNDKMRFREAEALFDALNSFCERCNITSTSYTRPGFD